MRRHFFAIAILFSGIALSGSARASTLLVDTVFNGASPGSVAPWLIANFQTISPGTVQLTLTADLNVPSEFIDEVDFNLTPGILPSGLVIVQTAGQVPAANQILHTTQNAQNINGGGALGKGFDISLQWPTASGTGRFDGTDVVTFLITYSGLSSSDLDTYTNTGGAGAIVAAHVQGIPQQGGGTTSGAVMDSGVTVPEPSALLLIGGGLIALGVGLKRTIRT